MEVLHRMGPPFSYGGPVAPLTEGTDGHLYGTTVGGGAFGAGSVFRMTKSGVVTVLHSFNPDVDGYGSYYALVQARDGHWYGTTYYGPPNSCGSSCGSGTVFRMTAAGEFSVIRDFGLELNGPTDLRGLVLGPEGYLYLITTQKLLRVAVEGAYVEVPVRSSAGHALRVLAVVSGADGHLYALAQGSTTMLIRLALPGQEVTILHQFDVPGGRRVHRRSCDRRMGPLCSGPRRTGAHSVGAEFFERPWTAKSPCWTRRPSPTISAESIAPSPDGGAYVTWARLRRYNYDDQDWTSWFSLIAPDAGVYVLRPEAPPFVNQFATPKIMLASDGRLYGTMSQGPSAEGFAFVMGAGAIVTTLHIFPGPSEGYNPQGPLVEAADGHFYGATLWGGTYRFGTVFRITKAGAFSVLYTFAGGVDGGYPNGPLVEGPDGALYGTTQRKGLYDAGTVFRLTRTGELSTVHAFTGDVGGLAPVAGLTLAGDGAFYGTTILRGQFDRGTVFRVTPGGAFAVLHSFTDGAGGAYPEDRLLLGPDGHLYGKAGSVVFKVTTTGGVTLMPYSGVSLLAAGPDGAFYGVVYCGGSTAGGYIFRMTVDGTRTALAPIGCGGTVTLTAGRDGLLYGTTYTSTSVGGVPTSSAGSIFVMTTSGLTTPLAQLGGDAGSYPLGVVQGSDGRLYATMTTGHIVRVTPVLVPPPVVTATTNNRLAVQLRWSPVVNATGYQVRRRAGTGPEVLVASGSAVTFEDRDTVRQSRYTYVVTAINAAGESQRSYEVSLLAGRPVRGDFDNDGRADIGVYRPSTGRWWIRSSADGSLIPHVWGGQDDVPVLGDFDGDWKTDVAVVRPSTRLWYLKLSSGVGILPISLATPSVWVPAPGDYDGNGLTDVAAFSGSLQTASIGVWYIQRFGSPPQTMSWGQAPPSHRPVPGDYDGDGKADLAVFEVSTGLWYIKNSSGVGVLPIAWGVRTDILVPADYDGDGRTDVAVYRPTTGAWYIRKADGTSTAVTWGAAGDIPVPADYDGDGSIDIAVFRPSVAGWYIRESSSSTGVLYHWGDNADIPLFAPAAVP